MRYYTEQQLREKPSFRDGINEKTESKYRKECINFILEVGNKICLKYHTAITAINFFHRFFMEYSFKDFPRYVIACNCIFESAITEGQPIKKKDIANGARLLLCDEDFKTFGKIPIDQVTAFGNIVLEAAGPFFRVKHAYEYVELFLEYIKFDETTMRSVVQTAWKLFNNSLDTTLCLQWGPELIAAGIVNLSIILNNIENVDWRERTNCQQNWWNVFFEYLDENILDEINYWLLKLYLIIENSVEDQNNIIYYPLQQSDSTPGINPAPPMIPTFPFYTLQIVYNASDPACS